MTAIRCMIIEDEPFAADVLKNYIDRVPSLELCGVCSNAIEAFHRLQTTSVDLLFLDIKMPQLNGIDFLKSIDKKPLIIFTTAFREYAFDGFEQNAVDFLLKPISFDRFLKSISRVMKIEWKEEKSNEDSTKQDPFLYIRVDRKMIKLRIGDIYYIESLKDYVKIVVENKKWVTKHTITALETMLPDDQFVRSHRSYLVNMAKVEAFTPSHLQVKGIEIPIGPTYRQSLQQIFKWNA